MKHLFLNLIAAGMLLMPTLASAQLAITLTPSTLNLTAGQTGQFSASLENIGASALTLTSLSVSGHSDLSFDTSVFFPYIGQTISPGSANALPIADFFDVTLSSTSAGVPYLYTDGVVTVQYNSNSFAFKGFNVQSQTPTPPVVLVTLFSGIGTVRMAMRRRKKTA